MTCGHGRPPRRLGGAGVLVLVLVLPVVARQALDRQRVPPPGPSPQLRVPGWTKAMLGNGAVLIVSEKSTLPLVSFTLTFLGGANQFEPADRRGVGALTAAMLSEGTATRDGDALSNALQLLGTDVSVTVSAETASIGFVSTAATFAPTLEIVADMLLRPTFPAPALERLRAQRLVWLQQAKAQPDFIAARVFPKVVYGPAHPFGQLVTDETIKSITRDDVVAFHRALFKPGGALVSVVGAIKPDEARAIVERALAEWPRGGERPAFAYPPLPPAPRTTIYIVDKPNAAQSTFAIGLAGPPRSTPDYFALEVMNTILGGQFQSRLNANLREEKGYSYGVSSRFTYGKGPGPFRAGGDIVSEKSDAALAEFMKELRGITGSRPVTDEELTTAKNALVQRLPALFASVNGTNGAIAALWVEELPDNYYQQYEQAIATVTNADVLRVARQYIDLDHLAIVVVGDRAVIEKPLQATHVAPIVALDVEGDRVSGL